MTTATVAVGNRTMDTGMARPRRSLEELVDRLIEAMFGAETAEPSATQTIHEARRLRQVGDVDGGAGNPRRHGHGEGGDAGGSLGLLRVVADGQAAVRRPGGDGLQPGRGAGRSPGSPRRRDV